MIQLNMIYLGFLCVDYSEAKFNPEYDVPLIQGVADGIYDIISKRPKPI